jgi:CDP-glucose 4,6-dehydratase
VLLGSFGKAVTYLSRDGVTPNFWSKRRVFLTGHTGFKGSWLSLWLDKLGAEVSGFALEPATEPALFQILGLDRRIRSKIADVRDAKALSDEIRSSEPEVVFHLAAQPLVRASYIDPLTTYATNVMGTAHLLDAVRHQASVRSVVIVTTDKCYENREWVWGYREVDRLGGHDPYSNSKACAELITQAYRDSFFSRQDPLERPIGIATARAGNVIGGGDWAVDRLLPDAMRAFSRYQTLKLRFPGAIRPWQHVLEPLGGYLMLAERLYQDPNNFSGSWNFGPNNDSVATVEAVIEMAARAWSQAVQVTQSPLTSTPTTTKSLGVIRETLRPPLPSWVIEQGANHHEAGLLLLDSTKSQTRLGWKPVFSLEEAVLRVVAFTQAWLTGATMRDYCLREIAHYQSLVDQQMRLA